MKVVDFLCRYFFAQYCIWLNKYFSMILASFFPQKRNPVLLSLFSFLTVYDQGHRVPPQHGVEGQGKLSSEWSNKSKLQGGRVTFSEVMRMPTTLRLLLLSTFLVVCLSAPKFHLIETEDGDEDEAVEEVVSSQEERKRQDGAISPCPPVPIPILGWRTMLQEQARC